MHSRRGARVANVEPLGQAGTASGDDAAAYAARARRLGLSFAPFVDLAHSAEPYTAAAIRDATFAMSAYGERLAYIAPPESQMPHVQQWLRANPAARARLRVTTPAAIRSALERADASALLDNAVNGLARAHPRFSAAVVATRAQVVAWLVIAAAIVAAFALAPTVALSLPDVVGALFFFGVSAIRLVAASRVAAQAMPQPVTPVVADDLPVYTILVPLYREAHLLPELVASLERLEWPRERLDIKLVLEASDPETVRAAAHAIRGRAGYEVVVVPQGGPQTKPKALSFALPLARGEFVAVYDAEDRPHPAQLRQAHAAFAAAGPEVACIQASLVIDNAAAGWLPLMFAVEYAALFDGLLPTLAAHDMPLPLGGTSNHFRRGALEAVGGWDPFNVTEDADLGLRFARLGYRALTMPLATHEDAPVALRAWLNQRTRWFKGWMQTWLVHTRSPVRLARELGVNGLLGFMLVGTGLIVSSLIYPIYLVSLVVAVADPLGMWTRGGLLAAAMLGVNLFNLIAGYVAMAMLSGRALAARGRRVPRGSLALLPLYWLLMSLAAYRAVWELARRPHHWAKTEHAHHVPPLPSP